MIPQRTTNLCQGFLWIETYPLPQTALYQRYVVTYNRLLRTNDDVGRVDMDTTTFPLPLLNELIFCIWCTTCH